MGSYDLAAEWKTQRDRLLAALTWPFVIWDLMGTANLTTILNVHGASH